MDDEEKVVSFLDSHENELVSFTQQLVRIRSENGNETAVAKDVAKKLRKYGIKSRLVGREKSRMNLVASIGRGKKSIILNGHLDTVKVTNRKKWKVGPFSGKIVSGKLFGRGAGDMKSGVAAITFAAIALRKAKLGGRLLVVYSSDEEGGGHTGVRFLVKKGLKADACLIAEPGWDSKILIGNRGVLRLRIVARGKTGHTGTRKKSGINAVTKMAKVLLALQETKFRFRKHKLFPKPKITPGACIKGGTAVNIVPGECQALVDCRLSFGQTKKTTLQDIKKVIGKLQKRDKELKVKIEVTHYDPPAFTDPKKEIVKICRREVKKAYGVKPKLWVVGWASDGNIFSAKKMPYLIFGPTGKNFHTENEWVNVKSIKKSAKVLALTSLNFLRN